MSILEVLDPMVLSSRVVQTCECPCTPAASMTIPRCVQELFEEPIICTGESRQLLVTLGQFSIIRLERDAQLVVPVVDYSIPTKECCDTAGCCAEDPCEMFSRIPFPAERFAPRGCDRQNGCGCQNL